MRHLLTIALVVLFFLLPVYMDFLQMNMYTYLVLGLQSPFPAPWLTILVFAAALLLTFSFLFRNNRWNQLVVSAALIVLNIPVVMVMARQWQLNSAWSTIAFVAYFALLIGCTFLILRNNLQAKKV